MGEIYRFHRRDDSVQLSDLGDPRARRIACRRILHEMVRDELADGTWGWFRRRALVRLARRLNLDEFEARLLIRAAEIEYAGGEVASADDERQSVVSDYLQPVPPVHPVASNITLTLAVIAVFVIGLSVVVWLARLVS